MTAPCWRVLAEARLWAACLQSEPRSSLGLGRAWKIRIGKVSRGKKDGGAEEGRVSLANEDLT